MISNLVSKKQAIQQLVTSLEKSWNLHDARMYAEPFAEDAEFTTVFGHVNIGRKIIEEGHALVFSTIFKNSSITITGTRMRFIKPDVVSVALRWEMNGARLRDENLSMTRKGLLNWILVYQNERWEIVVAHNAELPETPARLQSVLRNKPTPNKLV
jgi:uncharacterized protein (TIGR02246 family)